MQPILKYILHQCGAGYGLRHICRELLHDFRDANPDIEINYMVVKQWLTLPEYDLSHKDFREQYAIIQKRLIPIQMDEVREDAESLHLHTVDTPKGQAVESATWDMLRMRMAALKMLYTFHYARPPRVAIRVHSSKMKKSGTVGTGRDLSNARDLSNVRDLTNLSHLSAALNLNDISVSLPEISIEKAEEILGSPFIPYQYAENSADSGAKVFNPAPNDYEDEYTNDDEANEYDIQPAYSGPQFISPENSPTRMSVLKARLENSS